ncbi:MULTISPECIES: heme-degrading domain-containing protein [unclassified Mesorhizobium]|uniref:heme-degrading domain-containing protein n=1 Tax=unclassified Mesorhizobium TaxID=325217 RepID=UPI00112602AB|nr:MULTISPECIES: heme-degrading domain-containing protein [unclassified Mesorhizobium]MCA0035314.1 heme-degrading domain-containing protein [Mesorhizobium sp. B263B2A]TPN42823.1 heme-degrading domain-containing protein [Mesorhizobium sp. B1-1-7]
METSGADASRVVDIKKIAEQEAALIFEQFDETTAFEIGDSIRTNGLAGKQAVVVDIRLWDRQLFLAALPGSSAITAEWARRKLNSVRMFHKSSYRLALEQRREDRTFPPGYGLNPGDYVSAGGAFPIRIKAAGVIGALAVSGLSERADHETAVAALCAHLGKDERALALDP